MFPPHTKHISYETCSCFLLFKGVTKENRFQMKVPVASQPSVSKHESQKEEGVRGRINRKQRRKRMNKMWRCDLNLKNLQVASKISSTDTCKTQSVYRLTLQHLLLITMFMHYMLSPTFLFFFFIPPGLTLH